MEYFLLVILCNSKKGYKIFYPKGDKMKKKFFLTVALSALCLAFINAKNLDPTEGREKISREGVDIYLRPNSPLKKDYLSGKYDDDLKAFKKEVEAIKAKEKNKDKETKAPAPCVSKAVIVDLRLNVSDNSILESFDYKQYATTNGKYTGNLIVKTRVMGFGGSADTATFMKQKSENVADAFIDADGDRIMDGVDIYWGIKNKSTLPGNFVYTARSLNCSTTKTATLYIQ